jgi:hypothetical protein
MAGQNITLQLFRTPKMTDYKTVFTSLLAMDAYHRSLNQGVFHKRADEDFTDRTSKDAVGVGAPGGGAITQFGDASVYFTKR